MISHSDVDEVDRIILKTLAKSPRTPYSDIAADLDEEGHKMSSEGVRHRVSKLLDLTSIFFLLEPYKHDWEIVRLAVQVVDRESAKEDAMERLSEMPFWLVTRGVGSYDVYAVATAESNVVVDDLVTAVSELDVVDGINHSIETNRHTDVSDYLSVDTRDQSSN